MAVPLVLALVALASALTLCNEHGSTETLFSEGSASALCTRTSPESLYIKFIFNQTPPFDKVLLLYQKTSTNMQPNQGCSGEQHEWAGLLNSTSLTTTPSFLAFQQENIYQFPTEKKPETAYITAPEFPQTVWVSVLLYGALIGYLYL